MSCIYPLWGVNNALYCTVSGLSIQWGPVGEVGMFARDASTTAMAALMRYGAQPIRSCLNMLDIALQSGSGVFTSVV